MVLQRAGELEALAAVQTLEWLSPFRALAGVFQLRVLLKGGCVGEDLLTGTALSGGELGRTMILSSKQIRMMGAVVVPQARQLLVRLVTDLTVVGLSPDMGDYVAL